MSQLLATLERCEEGSEADRAAATQQQRPSTTLAQELAGVPDRAVGAVTVGQGEGVHLLLGGPLDEDVRVGRAVLQGVARRHVQVDERIQPASRLGQQGGGRLG